VQDAPIVEAGVEAHMVTGPPGIMKARMPKENTKEAHVTNNT